MNAADADAALHLILTLSGTFGMIIEHEKYYSFELSYCRS